SIMSSFALLWTLLGEVHDLSRENSFHASRTPMHYAGLTYHARPVPSRRERLRSRRGLISCAPSGRRGLGGLDARPLRLHTPAHTTDACRARIPHTNVRASSTRIGNTNGLFTPPRGGARAGQAPLLGGQIAKGILLALQRGFHSPKGMRGTCAARTSPTS